MATQHNKGRGDVTFKSLDYAFKIHQLQIKETKGKKSILLVETIKKKLSLVHSFPSGQFRSGQGRERRYMAGAARLMEILTGNPLGLWLPLVRVRLSSGMDTGRLWAQTEPDLNQTRARGGCCGAGFTDGLYSDTGHGNFV